MTITEILEEEERQQTKSLVDSSKKLRAIRQMQMAYGAEPIVERSGQIQIPFDELLKKVFGTRKLEPTPMPQKVAGKRAKAAYKWRRSASDLPSDYHAARNSKEKVFALLKSGYATNFAALVQQVMIKDSLNQRDAKRLVSLGSHLLVKDGFVRKIGTKKVYTLQPLK